MKLQENTQSRRIRLIRKRIFVVSLFAILIISSIAGVKALVSPKRAFAGEVQSVNLVGTGQQYNMSKEMLDSYNGQVRKVAYLTFDDGPSIYLPQVLDILKKYNVKGTFFMIGENLKVKSYQENVKRALKEGNYVGVHSMTHDYHHLYTEGYAVEEMKEAISLLHQITGTSPTLVRFPYGTNPGLKGALREKFIASGLKTWDWTVDSLDWNNAHHPEKILENVKQQVHRQTEVILMHERKQTVKMLPAVIEYLQQQGYELEVYDENNHFPLNLWNDKRM